MKRRVQWTRTALNDLAKQITYIADRNPSAAARVNDRIRKAGRDLATFATGHPAGIGHPREVRP